MVAQCTAHAQLKSVCGVSRVTCHRTPDPPITSQRSEGLGSRLKGVCRNGGNRVTFYVLRNHIIAARIYDGGCDPTPPIPTYPSVLHCCMTVNSS